MTGVAFVAVYAFLFRSIGLLVGFTIAVVVFFPLLIITGITAGYITLNRSAKLTIVDEDNDTQPETSP
jgi:hypothetical protein